MPGKVTQYYVPTRVWVRILWCGFKINMAASEHRALEAFASYCNKPTNGFLWLVLKEIISIDQE